MAGMSEAPGETVVLCGAGVSVLPPSSVPSWWGFNQSVLDELVRRFVNVHQVPVRAAGAVARLSLDVLDVAEFSQVVSDAFAGDTWFDVLGVLDGLEPNANHQTLARWAVAGSLRAVVTTNFDTLIERAMESMDVEYRLYDCLLDEPPPIPSGDSSLVVVKLHGSAPRRASLVDLAAQKRRGLPTPWLDWLESIFGNFCVAVAGFSGADLSLGEDYLRLRAASARTPELRWLTRSGQQPLDGVEEVVRMNGARGRFVEGDLPTAWGSLGAPEPVTGDWDSSHGKPPADDASPDVSTAIDSWLSHPMVDADTCGMALTRLLDAAGRHSAAAALRTSIRTRVRRSLRDGLNLTAATRAAMQIGQLARDEPVSRGARAIADLDLANRALDAVLDLFPPNSREKAAVQLELAHNRATLWGNIGYFHVLSGRLAEATAAVALAADHAAALSGPRRVNHDAAQLELSGAIAYLGGEVDEARLLWQRAHGLARKAGHLERMKTTAENLRRLDHEQGASR